MCKSGPASPAFLDLEYDGQDRSRHEPCATLLPNSS